MLSEQRTGEEGLLSAVSLKTPFCLQGAAPASEAMVVCKYQGQQRKNYCFLCIIREFPLLLSFSRPPCKNMSICCCCCCCFVNFVVLFLCLISDLWKEALQSQRFIWIGNLIGFEKIIIFCLKKPQIFDVRKLLERIGKNNCLLSSLCFLQFGILLIPNCRNLTCYSICLSC